MKKHQSLNLETVLNSITDGLLVLDRNWRYTYFNETGARMIGMRREDLLGACVWELFSHAKQSEFYQRYHQAVQTGQPVHFEEYYPEPLNKWFECHCYPSAEGLSVYFHDITRRKLAEETLRRNEVALRESEERFRTMANAMPQLTWTAQPDGSITWYNQRWHEYTGTTPAQMEGWGWKSVHDPEVLPKVLERWKASIATGQPFEMEFPLRGADGRFRQFLTRVFPLKDPGGHVLQWFGTNTDVEKLKRSELESAALRDQLAAELAAMNRLHELGTRFLRQEDAQNLFQAILDAGIAILGADKGYVQLLDPASGELAITAQRGFDSDFVEFFSHIRAGTSACGTALQTRHCVIVEDVALSPLFQAAPRALQFKLAAGVRAVLCAPFLTRANEVLGVLSVHFAEPHRPSERDLRLLELLAFQAADYIERKGAEEAQARLAAIVAGSEDAIFTKTLDGKIRSWNAGAEQMFGYQAEEVIGQPVTLFVPPERTDEETQMLERLRRGESIAHYETVRVAKDGRRLDVSLTNSPVKDKQGRVVGSSRIVRDIGELMRAREVLARSREDLERLVEERTAKLQEALAELEHMSYSMIHDMRAPLRSMSNFATLVEEECAASLPPRGLDYFRRIREAASRLDRLVTGALNYNQVVRHDLAVAPVEVGSLMRSMIDTYPNLQPAVADINIEFTSLVLLGNESLLTQCLGNLLGNAVKFVAPGVRPHIRVWAESAQSPESEVQSQQAAGGHATRNTEHEAAPSALNPQPSAFNHSVRLWIEDNGIGIPKAEHERIFALFQQMHDDGEYPGTGIGLAIVRKAVERMGGRSGLESEPGKGSRFWIELAEAAEAHDSAPLQDAAQLSPAAAPKPGYLSPPNAA